MYCNSLIDFLGEIKIDNAELYQFNERINKHDFRNYLIEDLEMLREKYYSSDIFSNKTLKKDYIDNIEITEWLLGVYDIAFAFNHREANPRFHQHRYFYRGLSNEDYGLVSGIYRKNEKEENYYFRELLVRCPEKLSSLKNFNKLEVLNPLLTLKRGYAIAKSGDKAISSAKDVKSGDEVDIEFDDGIVNTKVI